MATLEKPITTQEELDAVIGERIARAKETANKKFEGWTSPDDFAKAKEEFAKAEEDYKKQISDLQAAAAETEKIIAEKDATIAKAEQYRTDLEKTRIALAAGLDAKYATRLQGKDAAEWKKDAEELAKDFASSHKAVPLGTGEPKPGGEPDISAKFAEWFNTNYNQ